jgi:hypothetical protein
MVALDLKLESRAFMRTSLETQIEDTPFKLSHNPSNLLKIVDSKSLHI